MTSLFDPPQSSASVEMPVDLITQGARGVSLLEFLPFDFRILAEESAPFTDQQTETATEAASHLRVMIDAARSEAESSTRALLQAEYDARCTEERSVLARLCETFSLSREAYFARAEEQVIRLALSIASRVLCREVQADVLHLQATVRAALSRVTDGSGVVLRVAPPEVEAWLDVFGDGNDQHVEVLADGTLPVSGCVLETTIGRVELGVAAQMEEIGRGFQELLRLSEDHLV